jgi:hypothetical protein
MYLPKTICSDCLILVSFIRLGKKFELFSCPVFNCVLDDVVDFEVIQYQPILELVTCQDIN